METEVPGLAHETDCEEKTLPSGILDPSEWMHLKDFQNRVHSETLDKEEVKAIILDQNYKHPFKRTMVPVDSDSFKWAAKLTTGRIIRAKRRKLGVMHLECCNIIWIGVKPRQCTHVVNDKLRKQLDMRAQVENRYKPTFIPVNLMQYRSIGGCPTKLDQRVVDQVEEAREEEQLTTASTQGNTEAEDSEDELTDGLSLG